MVEWIDEAIILDIKKYDESKSLITLLSKHNGLYNGLSKSLKKAQHVYQIGNVIQVTWRARLADHLGYFSSDIIQDNSSLLFHNKHALFALNSAAFLLKHSLPERNEEGQIYEQLYCLIQQLDSVQSIKKNYFLLEEKLLQYTGYALDYAKCTVTGKTDDLYYLSPKTGKAVSKTIGAPYKDKLFPLPSFFIDPSANYSSHELIKAFKITGYFIEKYLLKPKNFSLPEVRYLLIYSDKL